MAANSVTKTAPTVTVAAKRAFAYLRVSSEGQVNTGYSRDGLSIDAQREAAEDKAAQLGAEITKEFSDPGRSAFVDLHKRTDFLEMLDELKRRNEHTATRIDYVIVWALNRWARSVEDHFRTHKLVREAGAKLISITEPMVGEDTPESFYMEGMFALNNQYESMKTGRNVRGGLYQKAKAGGSYGGYRVGYVTALEQLPDGRTVRAVVPDPQRHAFVTTGFQLYASGEYSLSQLSDELFYLGLRSRATKHYASGQIGAATLQRLLRNPYYLGLIVYKRGTPDEQTFPGRHEALIDQATFDAVQTRLDEKRLAGERPQKHQHYLRGTAYCGECGRRMVYGLSRSGTGQRHAYYFCIGRMKRRGCSMRTSIRPELIETAIQRYYVQQPIQLSAADVQARTEAIEALVAVSQEAAIQVRNAKTELVGKLQAQQMRLIRLHAEEGDDISPDAFRAERQRMQREIQAAETSLAQTEEQFQLDAAVLRLALELAENISQVYATASEQSKRGYNQAFFQKLYITPEWDEDQGRTVVKVTGAELTEPYAALLAEGLVDELLSEVELIRAASTNAEDGSEKPSSVGLRSNVVKMAERAGFEPAMEFDPHTRLAGECLQPLGHLSRGLASKFRRTAARPVLPDAARPVHVSPCGWSGRRR
jgi:site-specific DNA recombinase